MSLKSLAKQTIVYGVSTILIRMASWLLAPYYSYAITKQENGVIAYFMSIIAFLNILYMFGMETSYFRHVRSDNKTLVFQKTESIVFFNSLLWSFLICLFARPIVSLLGYPGKEIYVYLFTLTLFFENLCNIPFAQLRYENKALRFVSFKAIYIFLNISLNLIFLSYFYANKVSIPILNISDPIELIFWANFIPWLLLFLYFSPKIWPHISWSALQDARELIAYSWPLLIVGTAGMVNEVMDRLLLMHLLPGTQSENKIQVGLYSINYKLSIIMTLFIQAFRMAAEPYFFKLTQERDSKSTNVVIMDFFVIVCCIVFVITSLNRRLIGSINEESFLVAIDILPILLLANLFLGMYYNTSIWYKATNNNLKGAYIAIIGAFITLSFNWFLIPLFGYEGSAWTTLLCYFTMFAISMIWGRRHYPIPYRYLYNSLWILGSVGYSIVVYRYYVSQPYILIGLSAIYLLVALYLAWRHYRLVKTLL